MGESLKIIIRAPKDIPAADFAAIEAMAKRAGATITASLNGVGVGSPGGAGGGAKGSMLPNALALREIVVLMREIGRGNWSRVPGSFSILLQSLGFLKYLLNPIVLAFTALGTATFFAVKGLIQSAQAVRNFNNLLNDTNTYFAEQRQAMKQAAISAQENQDWIDRLGRSEESLTHKITEQLRVMRERYHLQRQLASEKGATPGQLASMDVEQAQKELAFLKEAEKAAKAKLEADKQSEIAAANAARSHKVLTTDLEKGGTEKSGHIAEIIEQIKQKMVEGVKDIGNIHHDSGGAFFGTRGGTAKDVFTVKDKAGNEFTGSLEEAEKKLSIAEKMEGVSIKQKHLEDAVSESKSKATKSAESLLQIQEEAKRLASDLALKQEFLPQLALGLHKTERGHLSSNQQIGAFAANAVSLYDIGKQQLVELKGIHNAVKKGNGPIGGGGSAVHF